MKHIMVDLETLAEAPNAIFPSLAAVQFDLETGRIGKKFSANINIDSAVAAGLVVDASTVGWWFTQPPDVAKLMFLDPQPLVDALQNFSQFLIECYDGMESIDQLVLWGNSARYDLGKLAWAYKAVGYDCPWNTWNEKCYRTYTKLFHQYGNAVKKHDVKHDPIQDCEFQIRKLVAVHKEVNRRIIQHDDMDATYTHAVLLLTEVRHSKCLTPELENKIENFMHGKIIVDDPK